MEMLVVMVQQMVAAAVVVPVGLDLLDPLLMLVMVVME
tara:strand:- start:292 stop:405 length:114 start_codon:yes stop_codon:yes gene_type:complete